MSTHVRPPIVRDGLIAYYDAANIKSYPGTGITWSDLSGNSIHGTLVNGPVYNSGNVGSFSFDGVNDYVDCGSSASTNFGTGLFTVGVWFKTNTTIRRTVISRFDYSTGIERGYYVDVMANGKVRAAFETTPSNYRVVDSSVVVNDNRFHYVVFVRSATTTAGLYVDGVWQGSNTLFAGSPSNVDAVTALLTIGRLFDYQTPTFSSYWIGSIGSIQMYNRVLTQAEVTQNYEAHKNKFGI